MSGFRSALETALRRGAGVLPPAAHTSDAFAATLSEATASPPLSRTVVPSAGRALVGTSQAAPCPPGFFPAPETTAMSPAGVLPPVECALGGSSPIGPQATASSPLSAIIQLLGREVVPATVCAADGLGRVAQLRTAVLSASVTLAHPDAGLDLSLHSTAHSGLDSSRAFAETSAIQSKKQETPSTYKNLRQSAAPACRESYRCNRLE